MEKIAIVTAIAFSAVVAFGVACSSCSSAPDNLPDAKTLVKAMSEDSNKQAPIQVDSITSVTGAHACGTTLVTYFMVERDGWAEWLLAKVTSERGKEGKAFIRELLSTPEGKALTRDLLTLQALNDLCTGTADALLDLGVAFTRDYSWDNGVRFLEVTVDSKVCAAHPGSR